MSSQLDFYEPEKEGDIPVSNPVDVLGDLF